MKKSKKRGTKRRRLTRDALINLTLYGSHTMATKDGEIITLRLKQY